MPVFQRRWLQFSLSTWFVLVGLIVVLTTLRDPWVYWYEIMHQRASTVALERVGTRAKNQRGEWVTSYVDGVRQADLKNSNTRVVTKWAIKPQAVAACLVLAGFLGWKAAWLIRQQFGTRQPELPEIFDADVAATPRTYKTITIRPE